LIDIEDMALAMTWAISDCDNSVPNFLVVNVGSNEWNFQVVELANIVNKYVTNAKISLNKQAPPDKRSYRVDFSLYKKYAGKFYPTRTIDLTINNLIDQISKSDKIKEGFRTSNFLRLNQLDSLIENKVINSNLFFID